MPFILTQLEKKTAVNPKGKKWKWQFSFLPWFFCLLLRYRRAPDYTCILRLLNLIMRESGHLFLNFYMQIYTLVILQMPALENIEGASL